MIKILIVDDKLIIRQRIKEIIKRVPDMVVEGEASNGMDAITRTNKKNYDVALLDISMPGKSGIEVLKELKEIRPDLPVLILSGHQEKEFVINAIKAGASGYLGKTRASKELIVAIRKILAGKKYISPYLAEKLDYDELMREKTTS